MCPAFSSGIVKEQGNQTRNEDVEMAIAALVESGSLREEGSLYQLARENSEESKSEPSIDQVSFSFPFSLISVA